MSASCSIDSYTSSSPPALDSPEIEGSKTWVVVDPSHDVKTVKSTAKEETNFQCNILKKISVLKKKFHQDRKILVKHLPRNVKESEIADMFTDFKIKRIDLANNDDKSGSATIFLENPEVLDEWDHEKTFLLRSQTVCVNPSPTEMVLCIARLPLNYTENDFYKLIHPYGKVEMYFLMMSERTGNSKGYGFVRYANRENALLARNMLNDKFIETYQLVCDWLDSSHICFNSLHSKCLYVDNLPKNFRDMGEFRSIFERIIQPPYCQIALRKGCPLDWGLVEYLSPDHAEVAQISCNNYKLRNQIIRVVYYIPGTRAINLMLSLLDSPAKGKSNGLLPDPTSHSVRMSINNLSRQNPLFAANLQNIILHQMEYKNASEDMTVPIKIERSLSPTTVLPMKPTPNPSQCVDVENIMPSICPPLINRVPLANANIPIMPSQSYDEIYSRVYNELMGVYKQPLLTQQNSLVASQFTITPPTSIPTPNLLQSTDQIINFPFLNLLNPHSIPPPTTQSYPGVTTIDPLILQTVSESFTHSQVPLPSQQPQDMFTVPSMTPKLNTNSSWHSITPFITASSAVSMYPPPVMSINDSEPWNVRLTSGALPQQLTPVTHHISSVIGQKRKLLPSPEKSPEGNYIGQHSQGLGGHYPDTYLKKKKTL